jgi:regulator of protease activity HflC (stomatin/prohibitin superfamily)
MNFATLLQGFVGLLWAGVLGLFVLAVIRASRGFKTRGITTAILGVAVAAVVVTSVSAGLVFIQPTERGVVISALSPTGYRDTVLEPGLRWIIPYFENVVRYSIAKQTYTMSIAPAEGQIQGDDSITARTADGQEVFIDASVIFNVDPTKVVRLHIDWQNRYMDELVRPVARGVIRDIISQYKVEEMYSTKRAEMSQRISDLMAGSLAQNGLLQNQFILRNITFSPEYAASIEQKQVAEQQAAQAKLVVEQKKQEAEQARQTAQGRADAVVIEAKGAANARLIQAGAEKAALLLYAEALQNNNELLTYTYINKLAPGIQVMLVPSNSPFLLPLPNMGPTAPAAVPTIVPTPLPTTVP